MHEIDVGTASACFEHVRLVGAVLVREERILLDAAALGSGSAPDCGT